MAYKYDQVAILSSRENCPVLTPRPHTAATQAAGRAILPSKSPRISDPTGCCIHPPRCGYFRFPGSITRVKNSDYLPMGIGGSVCAIRLSDENAHGDAGAGGDDWQSSRSERARSRSSGCFCGASLYNARRSSRFTLLVGVHNCAGRTGRSGKGCRHLCHARKHRRWRRRIRSAGTSICAFDWGAGCGCVGAVRS